MNYGWIFILIASALSYYFMNKIKSSSKGDGQLTQNEKIIVILTELIDPVIAGAIYYYGWKDKFPKKAKQANRYSFIVLGIWVIAIAIILFAFVKK